MHGFWALVLAAIGTMLLSSANAGEGCRWDDVFSDNAPDNVVRAMTVHDDGRGPALFVGAGFSQVGDQAMSRIARWDGTAWEALGDGVNGDVEALAVWDDGTGPALYVGGRFTEAGGEPANRIARWDGSEWTALDSGLDGDVRRNPRHPRFIGNFLLIDGVASLLADLASGAKNRHNASAYLVAIGDGSQFKNGRQVSAWLGLTPGQYGTGGNLTLLGITKQGDRYARNMLIHGARSAICRHRRNCPPLATWVDPIIARRGFNKAVVALANKLARIGWVIVRTGAEFDLQQAFKPAR